MLKADLHVHTKFSDRPSEWILQRLGASESYTEPDMLFETALKRGMDLIAVTDHNKIDGALYLKEKYPDKVIVSVESTTYFPEDGCKIHLLVYNIDSETFEEIQKYREDIYTLRDYIKEHNLAYSVAHATFNINKRLTIEHIEKLIVLFDIFEVRNGARNTLNNQILFNILKNLTPIDIEKLSAKYKITPFSNTGWIKGFTGGSDDHAGIFIGSTYTMANAHNFESFIEALKAKRTEAAGRENNFEGFAFSIYKIAYEFAKSKSTTFAKSALSEFTSYLFEKEKLSFLDRIKLRKFRNSLSKNGKNKLTQTFIDIIDNLKTIQSLDIDEKLNYIYDKISYTVDEFLTSILTSISNDLNDFNIVNIIKSLSASIPGFLLAAPFFSSFKFMYNDRNLLNELNNNFLNGKVKNSKTILWFTDTLVDLNGVSITLQTLAKKAADEHYPIYLMTSLTKEEVKSTLLPENVINIEPIYNFTLPYYKSLTIKIPSLLSVLKEVYKLSPTEIYVSTPGPVGIIGVMIAQLLNVPCNSIYHTDFAEEAIKITNDERIYNIVDAYMKWFYNLSTQVLVPTNEYINILKHRGYNMTNTDIFRRGLDLSKYNMGTLKEDYRNDSINMFYAGRISKDKNLEFLFNIATKLHKRSPYKFTLYIAGDGPDFHMYKEKYAREYIKFLGRIDYNELPDLYRKTHLFLFPSTTDTFGMAVLEAQSSGVPAIVSHIGGPKEIVQNGVTGYVLPVNETLWINKILEVFTLIKKQPAQYNNLRISASKYARAKYDLDVVLKELFNNSKTISPVVYTKIFSLSSLKDIATGLIAS